MAAASGVSNAQISQQLQLDRGQVRLWRTRWLEATPELTAAEVEGIRDTDLSERISLLLDDRARPGTANYFHTEQVVQIVAIAKRCCEAQIACETPQTSKHPISHWTPTELAAEALKRGIVEKISPRSVGRFLKRGDSTASSPPLLVKCQS